MGERYSLNNMPFKDRFKRAQYQKAYWKGYYADPRTRAIHRRGVKAATARRRKMLRAWLDAYKLNAGCRKCGYSTHPAALDFAHRDRSTKVINIADVANRGNWSLSRTKVEVMKCDVLCANCHRIETVEEHHYKAVSSNGRSAALQAEKPGSTPGTATMWLPELNWN